MQLPQVVICYATRQAHVDSSFSVARLCALLAEALHREGFGVSLYSPAGGVKALPTYHKPIATAGFAGRLTAALRRRLGITGSNFSQYRFSDAVWKQAAPALQQGAIVISPNLGVVQWLLRKLPAAQVVYWVHNYPTLAQLPGFLKVVKRPVNLVTPSRALYQLVWERLHENTLAFLHYHVPNFGGEHMLAGPQASPQRNKIVILHASGTSLHKGMHLAKAALQLLPGELKQAICFRFIGGADRAFTANGVEMQQLPLLAPGTFMQECLGADIGLMPSLWFENAPLTLAEFLCAGMVPVVSRSGGMPEMLEGFEAVIIDEPNNPQAWADALAMLLEDGASLQAKRQHNRRLAKSHFADAHATVVARWSKLVLDITSRS